MCVLSLHEYVALPTTGFKSALPHTLSFASRSIASVKLLDANSVCILGPQFCDSAFASYVWFLAPEVQKPGTVALLQECIIGRWHFDGQGA